MLDRGRPALPQLAESNTWVPDLRAGQPVPGARGFVNSLRPRRDPTPAAAATNRS